MSQLTGKIYLIEEDFAFSGVREPKTKQTSHIISKVEHVLISEHAISFTVMPYDYKGEEISYNVNLSIDEIGFGFTGSYSNVSDPDAKGNVKCELFSNSKQYMLYGRWIGEDEGIYTFWSIINK